MRQTMRWFGPDDPVSLRDIRQAGCSGVVTALHHVPNGAVWTREAIEERLALIAAAGLEWHVVESLPVHEAIKTRASGFAGYIDAYKDSLRHLAGCGLKVITYNFMPVLDWTRTDLAYALPDGALALRFEMVAVAVYDVHVLRRPGAERDYAPAILAAAEVRFASMRPDDLRRLERTIIAGLPGSEESFDSSVFQRALDAYADIDEADLKDNLTAFLREICPLCDELGLQLAIHPDDPPFALFGLPRVVSTGADLAELFARVPNPSNGLCFCTGSLGVRLDNDLPAMVERFGSRIVFLHLRNIAREENEAFHESTHLYGSVDMPMVVSAIRTLSIAQGRSIPMRPDHGHQILDDLHKVTNPGYSAIGRLKGLAELRGLELGLDHAMQDRATGGRSTG